MSRLGIRTYSFRFPLIVVMSTAALNEFYAYVIMQDPNAVGATAIFVFLFLIVYFAFRDGRKGGFFAALVTILYYFYIISTREYEGERLIAAVETTALLGSIYFLIAWIIGWLKEEIDILIEREADGKKRLETIFQQLPVGVLIADRDSTVIQSNKRLGKILGIEIPLGFKMGSRLLLESTHQGRDTSASDSPITQAIKTGKAVTNKEFTFNRNGETRYVQVSASPIRDRQNRIIAAASIISDISEQKKMELRKDDFVNMASHELKTPLTSIKLYTDIIGRRIRQYHDKELKKIVDRSQEQINRLQILVDDLLDVSRIQTGKLTFQKVKFDINTIIHDTIELTKEAANSHNIQFNPSKPVYVYADKFRISQVLTNLITNAVKYSPEKSNIVITSGKKDKDAVVSIQDFGIGIPLSEQEKIFERLYQVFETADKKSPGFGMGLFISKEIIEKHKGCIWVESEVGKGSTFCITLPLAK